MKSKHFCTSYGAIIPAAAMNRAIRDLDAGEDWQSVSVKHIRQYIPEHDEDLSELNEVLAACESIMEITLNEAR